MKIKIVILIFLAGIIIGISIAPLTGNLPEQAFLSPITPTLAQTRNYILPVSEGQVLGLSTSLSEDQNIVYSTSSGQLVIADVGQSLGAASSSAASQLTSLINEASQSALLNPPNSSNSANQSTPLNALNTPNSSSSATYSNFSGNITVAVIGDSMTDLMGTGLPYLKKYLVSYYPKATLSLFNYGVGAENIEKVADRVTSAYNYQDRSYPALVSLNPDIVVVESCAYNPLGEGGNPLDRHWSAMSKVTDVIKNQSRAKIIILATIAPSKQLFGQGPGGVNWPTDLAWQHANTINQYLENAISFSRSAGFPLVDAYHSSQSNSGDGILTYINTNDHIHQSIAGNDLIARLLAIKIYNVLGY